MVYTALKPRTAFPCRVCKEHRLSQTRFRILFHTKRASAFYFSSVVEMLLRSLQASERSCCLQLTAPIPPPCFSSLYGETPAHVVFHILYWSCWFLQVLLYVRSKRRSVLCRFWDVNQAHGEVPAHSVFFHSRHALHCGFGGSECGGRLKGLEWLPHDEVEGVEITNLFAFSPYLAAQSGPLEMEGRRWR